jgi:hypothetical protein
VTDEVDYAKKFTCYNCKDSFIRVISPDIDLDEFLLEETCPPVIKNHLEF